MIPDPTDEIKVIRRKLAAKFDDDVRRIGADIRRQQRESGRIYITLRKREPVLTRAAGNHPMQRSGGGDVSSDGESTPAAR
jgi:hypothetical protein